MVREIRPDLAVDVSKGIPSNEMKTVKVEPAPPKEGASFHTYLLQHAGQGTNLGKIVKVEEDFVLLGEEETATAIPIRSIQRIDRVKDEEGVVRLKIVLLAGD